MRFLITVELVLKYGVQKGPFLSLYLQLRNPLIYKGLETDKRVMQNCGHGINPSYSAL